MRSFRCNDYAAMILSLILLNSCSIPVSSIFADEVGKFDFLISTAGHGNKGGATFASFLEDHNIIVTSDSESCHVTGRNSTDGTVLYRRNPCSSGGIDSKVAYDTAVTRNGVVVSIDSTGILRGWSGFGGEFLFDYNVDYITSSATIFQPKIFLAPSTGEESKTAGVVGIASGSISNDGSDLFSFHSDITGKFLLKSNQSPLKAEEFLISAGIEKTQPKSSSSNDIRAKVLSTASLEDSIIVLMGWVFSNDTENIDSGVTSLSNMAIVQFIINEEGILQQANKASSIQLSSSFGINASSIQLASNDGKFILVGHSDEEKSIIYAFGIELGNNSCIFKIKSLPPEWQTIESTKLINSHSVSVSGLNSQGFTESVLFTMSDDNKNVFPMDFVQIEGNTIVAVATCTIPSKDERSYFFTIARASKGFTLSVLDNIVPINYIALDKVLDISSHGEITDMRIQCPTTTSSSNHIHAFITTTGSTSVMVSISPLSTKFITSWIHEESLASISDAVFLDRSSHNAIDDENMETQAMSVSHRLDLQWKTFQTMFSDFSHSRFLDLFSSSSSYDRDFHFGFAKVAVLLSAKTGRLFGLDTLKHSTATTNAQSSTPNLLWSYLLNPDATDHKLIHGGVSSNSGVDGGASKQGTNELLILSFLPESKIEYKCIDGIHGHTYSSGFIRSSLPVSQIIPVSSLFHGKENGGCKQIAMLLHEDGSVDVVPKTVHTESVVKGIVERGSRNGFYTHAVDKAGKRFRSYKIKQGEIDSDFSLKAERLGETLFEGETILEIAYPQRGEVVSSPATILGDDSLLLKYLNPHLVVIVTYGIDKSDETEGTLDPIESALLAGYSGSGKKSRPGEKSDTKKKPLGATNPGEAAPKLAADKNQAPKLFINLVDSVSSKILHRVSHSHASASHAIPILISENWIIYTYFNTDTKRTDVGVLTLHEGMIDKYGITAFHSEVQQELEFSSFSSEKPIVLSKVYTLGQPKTVTSLGVTQSARGISSKLVLFALGSNQILSVDRRWLDPRRPTADPKQSEKMEGLQKYAPVLPMIPQMTTSYTLNVEGVKSISTSPANVESHTLLLAHGGPDIFFTRLSPSKGFDLLPDEFNKGVLSVVVLALLGVLLFLQHMNKQKFMAIGWS